MLNAKSKNVSVIAFARRKLQYLKMKLVRNPNARPMNRLTMPIVVDTMQILLICALLCSSDVVAAVSIVDYSKQPKLYSCIFGEGVVNDAVSIILFNTILQL